MKLETDRLVLREWAYHDVDDLIEGLNDIEVSKWLAYVPYPYSRSDAERWIEYCLKSAHETAYEFAIELKSKDKVIGGVSLNKIDRLQGTAGGGVWISTQYHGLGYGTEAFGRRIAFAFNELRLRRLENGFFEGNTTSLRMQERFGYVVEGKRRRALLCLADGAYKDEYITGLLREDWTQPQ